MKKSRLSLILFCIYMLFLARVFQVLLFCR